MNGTRAHTVPQFLLRGFVAPESENARPIEPFVWLAEFPTGKTTRRAPKNVSISRGLYDGQGGFEDADASIERHLAKIESEAARAIEKLARGEVQTPGVIPSEIWRFLSWQAARTPAWLEIVEDAVYHWDPNEEIEVVEPPVEGFERIRDRERFLELEHPDTGERRHAKNLDEVKAYHAQGWKLKLSHAEKLEMIHFQAWYFQARHFARFKWSTLRAPDDDWFVLGDRGVAWIVDGLADTPPSALRHPTACVIAPLTRALALIGRHDTEPLGITPRQLNQLTAFMSANWVAGPTQDVVENASSDRARLSAP